jgi:CelD/BcsL family acetyltransferase involved in cellulose biosynthesis
VRRTIIAQTAEEIARLRPVWDRLPVPTIFQSFLWNHTAARVFGESERPFVIYAESDGGSALIPGAVRDKGLTLLGETLFDYRDVLVQGDAGALHAAWQQAAALHSDFSAGALRGDSDITLWDGFERSPFYGAPIVRHSEIAADQFASEHNRLGRWGRRFEREGVHFRTHTGAETSLVRRIYELKGSQPAESGDSLFRDPRRVDFMISVCEQMGSACEIFTFESAGSLIASLVTFREEQVRRFYTVQFDPAWAKYSPGMVLIYLVTQDSLRHGLDCDYMTGEHAYKMRFATSVVPMYWVQASAEALRSIEQERAA